jgi:hypothetical protein
LQTTANWTAQILLYPIYMMFQTVRLVGASLKQAIALEATTPPSHPASGQPTAILSADTPIQNALQAVQGFTLETELPVWVDPLSTIPIPVQPSHWSKRLLRIGTHFLHLLRSTPSASPTQLPHSATPSSPAIQAIASLLQTRTLVLVTNQNQVLDILTPEQQDQLRRRIAWETAHYGRYLHLRQVRRQTFARLEQKPVANNHVILPVRLLQRGFRALMAWVQSSPLAVGANLFREADLASLPPVRKEFTSRPALLPTKGLRGLLQAWNPRALLRESESPSPAGSTTSQVGLTTTSGAIAPAMSFSVLAMTTTDSTFSGDLAETGSATSGGESCLNPTVTWDYIDTEATPIGYVLEPLDQLLRSVDQSLLWLERQLNHFWTWLGQRQWLVSLWRQLWHEEWLIQFWQRVRRILQR